MWLFPHVGLRMIGLWLGSKSKRNVPSHETWGYNVRLLDAKTDKHENEVIGQKCN